MTNNWHLMGNSAQEIILEKRKEKRCRKTEEKAQTQLECRKDT